MSVSLDQDPRWLRGLELLRQGAWFDAHEVLEDPWRELPAGPLREAAQGVIQAAVALEHLRRGNPNGADKVWARARARWGALPDWPLTPQLARWATALLAFMERIDLSGRARAAREGGPSPPLPSEGWPRLES